MTFARWNGSFQGATHEGLNLPPYGNVSRITLVEGKYLFLIDENDEPPWSAELLRLGVLEVQN